GNRAADLDHLVPRLLHPVLAERLHPGLDRLTDPGYLDRLRDADEEHVRRAAAGALRGFRDPFTDPLEIGANVGHLGVILAGGRVRGGGLGSPGTGAAVARRARWRRR